MEDEDGGFERLLLHQAPPFFEPWVDILPAGSVVDDRAGDLKHNPNGGDKSKRKCSNNHHDDGASYCAPVKRVSLDATETWSTAGDTPSTLMMMDEEIEDWPEITEAATLLDYDDAVMLLPPMMLEHGNDEEHNSASSSSSQEKVERVSHLSSKDHCHHDASPLPFSSICPMDEGQEEKNLPSLERKNDGDEEDHPMMESSTESAAPMPMMDTFLPMDHHHHLENEFAPQEQECHDEQEENTSLMQVVQQEQPPETAASGSDLPPEPMYESSPLVELPEYPECVESNANIDAKGDAKVETHEDQRQSPFPSKEQKEQQIKHTQQEETKRQRQRQERKQIQQPKEKKGEVPSLPPPPPPPPPLPPSLALHRGPHLVPHRPPPFMQELFHRHATQLAAALRKSRESRKCLHLKPAHHHMHQQQRANLAAVLADIEKSSEQVHQHVLQPQQSQSQSQKPFVGKKAPPPPPPPPPPLPKKQHPPPKRND